MASKKIKELSVVTGTYESNGETKKRYKNVGALFQTDDGNQYLMLDRSFNPAGVPFRDGGDSIIVGIYDIKDRDGQQTQRQAPTQSAPVQSSIDGDSIPF